VNAVTQSALRSNQYQQELQTAIGLAQSAGELLRRLQKEQLEVSFKAAGEIVTNADHGSNSIICAGLAAAFPGDIIFSEETPAPESFDGPRVWIVDPLDSTSNYASGGTEYSISIGLAVKGEPVMGVVFNPSRNEMFAGCAGLGISLNGIPARPSVGPLHKTSRLLVSSKEWQQGLGRFARAITMYPMSSMAYKLARVSAGLDDAVLSLKARKPWGSCAGAALVLAAGGCITSAEGQPLRFPPAAMGTFPGLVACGRWKHDEVLKLARSLKSAVVASKSA
jgi:myo-inositol-1(or 4)-monophosphatase